MAAHGIPAKFTGLIVVCMLVFEGAAAHAQNAESILQKSREAYAQMKSYSDTGVVLNQYGASSEDRHTFSTSFTRAPRGFLFDFHKQGGDRYVIWGEGNAFHTWWMTTGQQMDYPDPNNAPAFTLSAPSTAGTAMKIPTLLYGKSQLGAVMLKIADPVLDGIEVIEGHHCHRITGKASDTYAASGNEVNIHKVTVWIDNELLLIRKMLEEWKPLPGQRNRTITVFQPQADPTLQEVRFKFVPPAR